MYREFSVVYFLINRNFHQRFRLRFFIHLATKQNHVLLFKEILELFDATSNWVTLVFQLLAYEKDQIVHFLITHQDGLSRFN